MIVETSLPGEFGKELAALLDKYKVRGVGGLVDGHLYLYQDTPTLTWNRQFWVSFEGDAA